MRQARRLVDQLLDEASDYEDHWINLNPAVFPGELRIDSAQLNDYNWPKSIPVQLTLAPEEDAEEWVESNQEAVVRAIESEINDMYRSRDYRGEAVLKYVDESNTQGQQVMLVFRYETDDERR